MKADRKGPFFKPVTTGTQFAGELWNSPSQRVREQRRLCPSAYQPLVEGCSRVVVGPPNFAPFGSGGDCGWGTNYILGPNGQSLSLPGSQTPRWSLLLPELHALKQSSPALNQGGPFLLCDL